jgi:pimeloyl-ACP methyl ester carboxylesterase
MPILGVYGRGDKIVDPRQAELIDQVVGARVEMMQGARHFPMLDAPDAFYATTQSFLDG